MDRLRKRQIRFSVIYLIAGIFLLYLFQLPAAAPPAAVAVKGAPDELC